MEKTVKNIDLSETAINLFKKSLPKRILENIDNGGLLLYKFAPNFKQKIESAPLNKIKDVIESNPIFLRIGNIQSLKILHGILNNNNKELANSIYYDLIMTSHSYSSTLTMAINSFSLSVSNLRVRGLINNQTQNLYNSIQHVLENKNNTQNNNFDKKDKINKLSDNMNISGD